MFNSPIRRRKDRLMKLIGTEVTIVDNEKSEVVAHGKLVYVSREQARHTRKNAGFYVGKTYIPSSSLREFLEDNTIEIDKSYLTG